jgi:hypothetical protein
LNSFTSGGLGPGASVAMRRAALVANPRRTELLSADCATMVCIATWNVFQNRRDEKKEGGEAERGRLGVEVGVQVMRRSIA